MSSLPAQRHGSWTGSTRSAMYVAGAVALVLAGWLVAGISDAALVPATAILALGGALALTVLGFRTGTLASPVIVMGVPLLLSLAAAMTPITRIFGDWSLATLSAAVLIVLAPLVGIGAAVLASPGRTSRLERGCASLPRPGRLITVCLLMCIAGTLVYALEWSSIGGPPLLSANIDKARFSLNVGARHVFTEGLPLALLIATWARVAHPASFTASQRRVLEAIMCYVPAVLALGGGRILVLLPLVTALVVAARYVSVRTARRMVVVIPIVVVVFSTAVFIARLGQGSPTGPVGTVLYSDSGTRTTSPLESTYRSLSINFGEQLRVVAELRDAHIHTPPFTSSIWFAHNIFGRAIDPHTITGPNIGGWLTSMYAGQLLLDFGLIPALLFGLALGAGAHMLYRRFARGRSVTIIWVYSYLAGPLAVAFYINIFLYFIFPIIDLIVLVILSRLLIQRPVPDVEGQRPAQMSPVATAA